ncbi:conserved hypothetical protein [Rhodopseudomonas palustris HaA2]|uniref:Uncharacterized protein n=1 Tax=Rhodopseudomonas palustris (strain HaA2) TaxID=316058 RepID=Q2J1T6_RHOP2|nr:hypothetical protein [Rhodopseudomonas palustris]ABD05574.1 conserved hypothetical protein [Rhodopseudomonas palustris HaA2]
MTKAATLLALVCLLIAGASAATILARDSVPAAGLAMAGPAMAAPAAIASPVSNRETKSDRLASAVAPSDLSLPALLSSAPLLADPSAEAAVPDLAGQQVPSPQKPIQLAYAADDSGDLAVGALPDAADKAANSAPVTSLPPVIATAPVQKPKPAAKPKPPALLSDAQISQLRGRLNLSSSQEYYWPSVEQALRAIGRKLHATRTVADSGPPPIDPDSAEVQQLKYAAMPLLFQLREDQKQEVRKLARAMGLEQVAQAI